LPNNNFDLALANETIWRFSFNIDRDLVVQFCNIVNPSKSNSTCRYYNEVIIFKYNQLKSAKIDGLLDCHHRISLPFSTVFISFYNAANYVFLKDCEATVQTSSQISDIILPMLIHATLNGGTYMHAATLLHRHRSECILLPGGSSQGKTTCANRVPPPWTSLCDDQSLVIRAKSNLHFVHPLPTWSNLYRNDGKKSWYVQDFKALNLISFLEASSVDAISRMTHLESTLMLNYLKPPRLDATLQYLPSSVQRQVNLKRYENACLLARSTPCFKLKTTLNGYFWKEIETVLHSHSG